MKRCKVYYSLLAICYLEVLLWTTCLLSSCATLSARVEDTGYLQRETCNLKQTIGAFDNQQLLPGFLDLRGGDLHTQEELLSLQRLKESVVTPALSQRPVITLASFLPVGKGVPAPYTGVKAIVIQLLLDNSSARRRRGGSMRFASATAALSESVLNSQSASLSAPPPPPPSSPKVDTKPASDVLAGAMARAASQGTIHPLDTLKVRMQSQSSTAAKRPLSKIAKLIPPAGADSAATAAKAQKAVTRAIPKVASLYRGVIGAASGAGIAIGTYFAFYGAASNMLSTSTALAPGQIAFVAGGMAAAGGSVVKVPLAVCIRSVQAGVYPNVFKAAGAITEAAGVRGLFTGYLPTLLEDVPDMAFKFAAYETLRQVHRRLNDGRKANVQEDFAMGACAGAFAAAATTPLDVIKTNMMCTAASRPTMMSAGRAVLAQGGPKYFFRGVGARALSNGINSAVFFCFFEALRATFAQKKQEARRKAVIAARNRAGMPMLLSRHKGPAPDIKFGKNMRPANASLSLATGPALELS